MRIPTLQYQLSVMPLFRLQAVRGLKYGSVGADESEGAVRIPYSLWAYSACMDVIE